MREDFVSAARSYIGTPFHHQGRLPGVGLDCIGLLVCAARAAGKELADYYAYPRQPTGELVPRLRQQVDEVSLESAQAGTILIFWIHRKIPQHVAIKTPLGMVHTYERVKGVVETRIDEYWQKRLCGAYEIRWQP